MREADYWRRQIAGWSDEKFVHWIRGIARLKLQAEQDKDVKRAYAAAARANHAFIKSGDTDEAKRVSDIMFAALHAADEEA